KIAAVVDGNGARGAKAIAADAHGLLTHARRDRHDIGEVLDGDRTVCSAGTSTNSQGAAQSRTHVELTAVLDLERAIGAIRHRINAFGIGVRTYAEVAAVHDAQGVAVERVGIDAAGEAVLAGHGEVAAVHDAERAVRCERGGGNADGKIAGAG